MYTQSITRANRTLFVLAIDESGSMSEMLTLGGRTLTKAEKLSEVANTIIAELIERSRRSDGIRDYYDVAIVGYSGDGVRSCFDGADYLPISKIAAMDVPTKQISRECVAPDGAPRIITENIKCWVEARSTGKTPMYEALSYIYEFVKGWCANAQNVNSFPPTICNITDGLPTDCEYFDIYDIASMIKALSTNDGATLLTNIHISAEANRNSLLFPTADEVEQYRHSSSCVTALYESASVMPAIFDDAICDIKGTRSNGPFKAMCYNSSFAELLAVLNIGSISLKRY